MQGDRGVSNDVPTPQRLAWLLLTKQSALIERWTQRVLDDPAVPNANKLSRPALEDNIPELIERLLARLDARRSADWGEREGREVGSSDEIGPSHAQRRFAVHFTIGEALRELSHFRAAALELCDENFIVLNLEESKLLHVAIDELMAASANELERMVMSRSELVMATVAHDLRNPLNVVTLHAEGLKRGTPADGATIGGALERSAKQMSRLVEDLLVMSKLELGHMSVKTAQIDVSSVVENVLEQLRHSANRKRIVLTYKLPSHEVTATCDPDRIEQALGNLVSNAIKFTPDGGRVGLELEASETEVIFRVFDTGPGISPEHRDRIFRPFWQGSGATTPGVGLGLAITRGIIEAHGGTIHVENPPSGGARFRFTLPLDGSESPSASFDIGREPG